jgi:hypothetical protein
MSNPVSSRTPKNQTHLLGRHEGRLEEGRGHLGRRRHAGPAAAEPRDDRGHGQQGGGQRHPSATAVAAASANKFTAAAPAHRRPRSGCRPQHEGHHLECCASWSWWWWCRWCWCEYTHWEAFAHARHCCCLGVTVTRIAGSLVGGMLVVAGSSRKSDHACIGFRSTHTPTQCSQQQQRRLVGSK